MNSQPNINLRALEPTDIELLYAWENDERVWFSSSTTRPLSKQTLGLYIDSVNDIYTDKQVRLIMEADHTPIGCVDLFDYDPLNQRAGVGIMVDVQFEGKGFALAGISALKEYAFQQLGLHQLYCNVASNNQRSITLFEKSGFHHTSTKKDWIRMGKTWQDELFFQCFNS